MNTTATQLKRLKKDELLKIAMDTTTKLTEAEQLLLLAAVVGGAVGFLVGLGF
jgi:hypothetical protein